MSKLGVGYHNSWQHFLSTSSLYLNNVPFFLRIFWWRWRLLDDCVVVSKFSSKGCVILKSIVWKIAWNESCQKVSWIFKLFRVLVVDSALLFFSSFANNACWTDFLYCYNGLVKEEKKINDTYTLSLTLNSRQDILDKIYINYLRGKTKTKEKLGILAVIYPLFLLPLKKLLEENYTIFQNLNLDINKILMNFVKW